MARLRRVFTLVPQYLRGDTVHAEKKYMDCGIQLGRRCRALKAWVIWRAFGREGMVAFMREHVRLSGLFADWIKIDNRFELAAPVVLPVVCFRFVGGDKGKIDISNSEIVARINASGRAYLTQTKLRGQTVMRIGLGHVLTTEQHVRNLWELITKTVDEVGAIDLNRPRAVR